MGKQAVDVGRRRFLTAATTAVGAGGAALWAWPFLASLAPSERAKALGAPVEIDISKLEPGQMITQAWRGRPVWVIKRTPAMLASLPQVKGELRDPDSDEKEQQPDYAKNETRSIKPDILVMVGTCTHLGCSPKLRPVETAAADVGTDWKGGFFCPCHGSKFDLAGRVFDGVPAQLNLRVPPHRYRTETLIIVGEDQTGAA